MLCPFTFLQGYKEISEAVFKLLQRHTYMTKIIIDNVQGPGTPKAGKSVTVLCFANCITVIYIYIKFQENISNSFQVPE